MFCSQTDAVLFINKCEGMTNIKSYLLTLSSLLLFKPAPQLFINWKWILPWIGKIVRFTTK